jgi:hypothetical protein
MVRYSVPSGTYFFAAVLFLWLSCSPAQSQSGWHMLEFGIAQEALNRGDCAKAWNVVWPLAKAGIHEARYFLWISMILKLVPPGHDRHEFSKEERMTHLLTLGAHGVLSRDQRGGREHTWARKDIPVLIRSLYGPSGEKAARCYEAGDPFGICLDQAISLGVVKRFADYARDVDLSAGKTGLNAFCWYPH